MTLDPGQPTKAVDLQHWRVIARQAAWLVATLLTLAFCRPSDQCALAIAYFVLAATRPPEPPL